MIKMKRFIPLIFVILLVAVTLVGCGGGNNAFQQWNEDFADYADTLENSDLAFREAYAEEDYETALVEAEALTDYLLGAKTALEEIDTSKLSAQDTADYEATLGVVTTQYESWSTAASNLASYLDQGIDPPPLS